MLKQLLKYEFKATGRVYGGLYLALAVLSVLLGVSFRGETIHLENAGQVTLLLILAYVLVLVAIAVLCIVTMIQRFYQNLLGREGYLMHTLPVTESQLILSKLLSTMVWVLCSGLVGIVCTLLMFGIAVSFDLKMLNLDLVSWNQLIQYLNGSLGMSAANYLFWTVLINLIRLACMILCVYAACMVAHQFKRYIAVAGILTYAVFNTVQGEVEHRLGTDGVNLFVNVSFRMVDLETGQTPAQYLRTALGPQGSCLLSFAVTAAFAAGWFCLARWLMKNKLNLE